MTDTRIVEHFERGMTPPRRAGNLASGIPGRVPGHCSSCGAQAEQDRYSRSWWHLETMGRDSCRDYGDDVRFVPAY